MQLRHREFNCLGALGHHRNQSEKEEEASHDRKNTDSKKMEKKPLEELFFPDITPLKRSIISNARKATSSVIRKCDDFAISGRRNFTPKNILVLAFLAMLPLSIPHLRNLKMKIGRIASSPPALSIPDFPDFPKISFPELPAVNFHSKTSRHEVKKCGESEDIINLRKELIELREELDDLRKNPLNAEKVKEELQEIVYSTLEDKTGMADYALESAGAEVLEKWTTPGIPTGNALMKIWNMPIFYQTMSPRLALQPNVHPGNCFAFAGDTGFLTVKLARPIYPTNFTIEHIPKALSFGDISSAPRNLTLEVFNPISGKGSIVGTSTFNIDGFPVQTFRTSITDALSKPTQFIRLRINSNWGNPNFTCLYRLRVHGSQHDF
ncbi:Oidioi.mRNA.OKI2018_I69.PAR.g8613.t1.cds [Oikopleura dioica]|uniref:Oidioi.mRNA.OKI2018_I69.PAR.g8613.t1.cds n=1 Tax=Oikopleura dioica TaxID=34765 RepID=A0ABN7RGS1_OIKDI|nr:Oidioi.mRNA.OKI2018_I69.PAR.g8613.t1.cds [Oikopleura dioica]